ncbi:GGDEF domain-containing protein [Iamia majanohamensis]|uniref:GGDEF domain-containing protein n=1 Tax=Iamia majanohamensis TaxID=467976 RepID=A0AAF0BUC4_9ACTN|nr:GGDEF domain-containing protein [Iamia majanohamensis]WCO65933.1 GGDEF domain-containing protein [Iamia majanohamensis]
MAAPARPAATTVADPLPTTPQQRASRVVPFLGALAVALGLAAFTPGAPTRMWLLAVATTGFLACAATIVILPWERLPGSARFVPVALFCASVGVVRAATISTNGRSGFTVFLLLAVVWQAGYGRRVDLVVTVGLVFATNALPIVVLGPPLYPASDWRAAAMVTFVAALIGTVVQRLVRDLRRERALVSTVAEIGRSVAAGGDPRRSLCQATVDLTGARAALLLEPDGDGLRVTESVGLECSPASVPAGLVADALRAAQRAPELTLVPEAPEAGDDGGDALSGLGLRGWAHQPVARHGTVPVVLSVAWDDPDPRPRAPVRAALELLAAEAAAAIDRADLLERLDRMARHDALTGLVNRRAWDDHLGREVARSARTGRPLSVALIDLDRFKAFNDLYGHLVGDQLLKAAAGAWLDRLRAADVLCRWGGEEFAVLMPDTPAEEARQALDRLAGATPMGQTFSGGFVTHVGEVAPEALMTGADQAVYRAKAAGRARVVEGRPAPPVTVADTVSLERPAP